MGQSISMRARLTRRFVASVPLGQSRFGNWEAVSIAADGPLTRLLRARPAVVRASPAAHYALKVLHPRWEHVPSAVECLHREAEVSRDVRHAHLVSLLESQLGAPPYFLVFPWLDGQTLAERLEHGRLEAAQAVWIARQVTEALVALARSGWMHGDVKPQNIMLGFNGHATLLDLGFARPTDEDRTVVDRCAVGSVAYVAPEMLTSKIQADARSDVYSLGATLYEALAGRPPFVARDLGELARQHRECRPTDLRTIVPTLPRELSELVHQMLAKSPWRRPQTPEELMDRLIELELATFDLGLE